MNKLNIMRKSNQSGSVEIGNGFYVNKVGKDPNGNSCVWVQKGAGRAKKIQLVGNIPNKKDIISDKLDFFRDKNDPDTKKSIESLKDYYKKYLIKDEKGKKSKKSTVAKAINMPLTTEEMNIIWQAMHGYRAGSGSGWVKDKENKGFDYNGLMKKFFKYI